MRPGPWSIGSGALSNVGSPACKRPPGLPGRKARLDEKQLRRIGQVLRATPKAAGLSGVLWDGKSLSAFIAREWGVDLKVRQCQRLFRKLNFRLRKPRPQVAKSDPQRQRAHKKTSRAGFGPRRGPVGD